MPDAEVENILREIRESVHAKAIANSPRQVETTRPSSNGSAMRDAAGVSARLKNQLAIIERACDQLPPLTSRRRGLAARLELWIKRHLKNATHWYTWEQVNFNSAVHDALREITIALSNNAQVLAELRDHKAAVLHLKTEIESYLKRLDDRLAALESKTATLQSDEMRAVYEANAARSEVASLRSSLDERVAQLRDEQRASFERLLDEQRVSRKQLALEVRETALDAEHARRIAQARLEELTDQIAELHMMQIEAESNK